MSIRREVQAVIAHITGDAIVNECGCWIDQAIGKDERLPRMAACDGRHYVHLKRRKIN
jgi:hypothetical protein